MKSVLIFAAAVLCGSPAAAVVVKDTFGSGSGLSPDELSVALGGLASFQGVAALFNPGGSFCSGALISPTAVLTARHCTDGFVDTEWGAYFGTGSTGFDLYGVTSIKTLAPDPSNPGNYFNGTDLALLELSSPVTDIDPYEVLTTADSVENFAIVGYGLHGTGTDGATEDIDLERRFALNTYESFDTGIDGNRLMFADFDNEIGTENTLGDLGIPSNAFGTLYEGMIASGDSGGPLLFLRDDQWVVGGVATGVLGFDGNAEDSDYGDVGVWTGVTSDAARKLVTDAGGKLYDVAPVPLPAPVFGLLAALSWLGLLRRNRLS